MYNNFYNRGIQNTQQNRFQNQSQPTRQNSSQKQPQHNFQDSYLTDSAHKSLNTNSTVAPAGSFEENAKLKSIDPLKLKIISEIKEQGKNKSIEEMLPQIMKINQELNRRNMNFTQEESALLLEAIEETLPEKDKQRFNMLKGFL